MGSGTTAVAALREKRNFVGYEINEDYLKLANDRIAVVKQELTTLDLFNNPVGC
jgi:site-specific DNA-methyltransferase (adenine-specific)